MVAVGKFIFVSASMFCFGVQPFITLHSSVLLLLLLLLLFSMCWLNLFVVCVFVC